MSSWLCKWFGIGCPPPATATFTVALTVSPVQAQLFITPDTGMPIKGVPQADAPQHVLFSVPSQFRGWGFWLDAAADGFQPEHIRGVLPSSDAELPALSMQPAFVSLLALKPNRHVLEQVDGTPWTAIECTDFRLFKRFLDGEDIRPQLRQRKELGFNLVRVFGMCRNLFDLNPANYPTYYDQLPLFCALLEEHGLRLEFSVFPDCALVMPSTTSQVQHWNRVGVALQPYSNMVLVELQNEADQPPNAIDAGAFSPLAGLLCSHGSNGSQAWPVTGYWAWTGFHSNGAPEWQRKAGHNAWEITGDGGPPVIANENTRYPDADNSLVHAFDASAGCALLCAGGCYHSDRLRQSEVIDGLELDAAKQWVAGAKSVNLSHQHDGYRHAIELEAPGVLRAYQRGPETVLIHV